MLIHAVETVTADGWTPDLVALLQPTVPIRRPGLVDDCVGRLLETGAGALLTGYAAHFVWWQETAGNERERPQWRTQCWRRPRRQDMVGRELMWAEDGSVYVVRTPLLLTTGSRLGIVLEAGVARPSAPIEWMETKKSSSIDIDTIDDWYKAEALLSHVEAA